MSHNLASSREIATPAAPRGAPDSTASRACFKCLVAKYESDFSANMPPALMSSSGFSVENPKCDFHSSPRLSKGRADNKLQNSSRKGS